AREGADGLFGLLELVAEGVRVEAFLRREVVREQEDRARSGLDEAGADGGELALATLDVAQHPGLERSEEREVARQNAELTLDARRLNRRDAGREREPGGRRHLERELCVDVGHISPSCARRRRPSRLRGCP